MSPSSDASRSHILVVEDGLERLMGDRALYLQLLCRFRQDYQSAPARIRQALASHQQEAAGRLSHTLKGAAGMIGAQEVQARALGLETGCGRPDSPVCMEALAALDQAMAALLAAIETVLNAGKTSPPPAAATPQPSAQLLLPHLARLLDEGDGAAIDVLEQSASVLAASLGVAVFQEVAAAAHQFDFEAALEALRPKL